MANKDFKSNISRPSESWLAASLKPTPFTRCPNCDRPKTSTAKYCVECARLAEIGFGPVPRAPQPTVADTQVVQSYPSDNHSGYSTTAPKGKFNPSKERV